MSHFNYQYDSENDASASRLVVSGSGEGIVSLLFRHCWKRVTVLVVGHKWHHLLLNSNCYTVYEWINLSID